VKPLNPSDLLALGVGNLLPEEVSFDTETSGLFPDDGARPSTASVAWIDWTGDWAEFRDRLTYRDEVVNRHGETVAVASVAWPFDQGLAGKPEAKGQDMLWPDANNLDSGEWTSLCTWLDLVGYLVEHNGPFDSLMLAHGPRNMNSAIDIDDALDLLKWDTMNVNNYLYPLLTVPGQAKPTVALKDSMYVLTGEQVQDEQEAVKKYLRKAKLPSGRWDLMPWDVIGPYADLDARLTIRLKNWQKYDIENGLYDWPIHGRGNRPTPDEAYAAILRRLNMAVKPTCRMEWRGLPYAEVESRDAADECVRRAAEIEKELPFEPPTADTAKAFFFTEGVSKRGVEHLDLPAYAVSEKTGEPSLTAEILGRMVNDRVPYADIWARYNKVTTAASMWYNGYADKMGTDGRLRMRFRVTGTVSTRFSAERVNLQATPQDYRLSEVPILQGIPTPRDLMNVATSRLEMGGVRWKQVELDLKQAELRVGAMFAQDDKMLQMMKDGTDLHTYTTLNLFPDVDPDDPMFGSKYRQVGKRGNFSLGFGSGWDTFQKMISKETGIILPEVESRRIVRVWNDLFPPWGKAIDRHSRKVAIRQARYKMGWVDLYNGERRWFHKLEETHKAFNQRVQASLAQFGMDWLYLTDTYLRGQGLDEYNAGLVLTIHDSQKLLVPDNEQGDAMVKICADFGNQLWKDTFPDVPGGVDYH
jgi:hypothetical protein